MENEIDKAITEAINKQLPTEVGEVLRQRLEEAKETEEELVKVTEKKDQLFELTNRLEEKMSKHEAIDRREVAVKSQEIAAKKVADEMNLKACEVELNAEKRISNTLENVLLGLVRNIEYRKNVIGTEPNGDFGTVNTTKSIDEEAV